jgi:hypothetical protein
VTKAGRMPTPRAPALRSESGGQVGKCAQPSSCTKTNWTARFGLTISPLRRRKVQTAGKIGPADLADEVRFATHDQLIAGTGQTNVEAFAGAFERRHLVDDEHDGTAFEPLEACPERICG